MQINPLAFFGFILLNVLIIACIGFLCWRRSWRRSDKSEILRLVTIISILGLAIVWWDYNSSPETKPTMDLHPIPAVPEHQSNNPYREAELTWILHSNQANGECEVPFTLYKGQIFVRADFAGVPLTCLVDTGTRDVIVQNAAVPYAQAIGRVNYPYGNHKIVPVDWRTLSRIRLGDYELITPQVVSWPLDAPVPGITWDGGPIHAILGNRAFKNIVPTIDYQRRKLILHRPDYDITQQLHRPSDCLCNLTLGASDNAGTPTYLAVESRIEAHPVSLMLDTGHCGAGILLAPEFRARLDVPTGTEPNFSYSIAGYGVTEVTRPLRWSIGNVSGQCPGWVIGMWPDHQASAGYNILRNYRVTIDYRRKKLLLEGNQVGQSLPVPPSGQPDSHL